MAQTKTSKGFSAEEKAAMRERAKENKKGAKDGEADLLAKVAEMDGPDREMAEGLHALIKEAAPSLTARTYYGMPAYAQGKSVLCFFQPSAKFKTRYSTFGFNDNAKLDDGDMWPTAFALTEWNADVEKRIRALVEQAVS